MLSRTRSITALALRSQSLYSYSNTTNTQLTPVSIANPTSALVPLRLTPSAFISTTSAKPATEVQRTQDVQGPPLTATGKPRREVPLPSQEKKEGVMQYALYAL